MNGELPYDPARADLLRGARLFDAGEHFEAHEVWEARWRISTDESERRFFQGLIQLAAAFHKLLVKHDPASSSRLLERALAKLDAGPDHVHGLDVRALCARVRAWSAASGSGKQEASELEPPDRERLPKIGA